MGHEGEVRRESTTSRAKHFVALLRQNTVDARLVDIER